MWVGCIDNIQGLVLLQVCKYTELVTVWMTVMSDCCITHIWPYRDFDYKSIMQLGPHWAYCKKKIKNYDVPSNLSPCPCPRQSGETAIAATSPHFSLKKGNRAAQAMI